MSILHLVRVSAFSNNSVSQCLATTLAGDSIVLLDDGCYSLHSPIFSTFFENNPEVNLYVVAPHAKARAISNTTANAENIEYANLVDLTFSHDKTVTWQ